MRGREARVTQETCLRGESASTSGTTSKNKKAVSARAGVRVPHSSLEAPESGVERRRGSCAEESKADRERGEGPKGIATPTLPEMVAGVRKLQRTLYRQAKSMGERHNTRRIPAHETNWRTASESRMREIRPSGSMRGRRVLGSTKRASLLYLINTVAAQNSSTLPGRAKVSKRRRDRAVKAPVLDFPRMSRV